MAYEWIVQVDPAKSKPLLAGMLDDPAVELRHDAVAVRIDEGDALLRKGQKARPRPSFTRRSPRPTSWTRYGCWPVG